MKNITKSMMCLVCSLGILTSSAMAQIAIPIYKEVGAASDLFHELGAMIGKTSVTPAWGLNKWNHHYFGKYSDKYFSINSTVTRNPLPSGFLYKKVYARDGSQTVIETTPFLASQARYGVEKCVPSAGFVFITSWSFELVAWVNHVTKSGKFPPGAPYRGHLSTLAHMFSTDCFYLSPQPPSVKYARFDLPSHGAIAVRFNEMPYEYHWPPQIYCF